MSDVVTHFWTASDGVDLAYHETGLGGPVVLLHGLFSDANMNWIRFGHAARIAAAGFRVIMPDLRAHGLSGRPHEPEYYPLGILARDLRELIAQLQLTDFDLGGSGPNLLPMFVGFGQKSGIYWALDPDNGHVKWSTVVGPGGTLVGRR